MKVIDSLSRFWGLSAVLCLSVGLTACGGSGSGPSEPSSEILPTGSTSYHLNGTAVKGPLASATVNVYLLDKDAPGFKGELVAVGMTTSTAAISGLEIKAPLHAAYLVEVLANTETIDISTGKPPVIRSLRGIASASQLLAGVSVSVTPITTMAFDLGVSKSAPGISEVELLNNIFQAERTVVSEFGFGLDPSIDIFSTPALVSNTPWIPLKDVVAYRSAVETVTSMIQLLHDYTGANTDMLLTGLAEDLSDGVIDGTKSGLPLNVFMYTGNLKTLLDGLAVSYLTVPNSDKDGDTGTFDPYTVDEMEFLLAKEAKDLGVSTDVSALENGTIHFTPTPRSSDTDEDGMPDLTDLDIDNDGVVNSDDSFPRDATETADSDGDGLGDNAEMQRGTDPDMPDTDGDALTDGAEIYLHHTNPLIADTDHDYMNDSWEVAHGFNPSSPSDAELDADDDGFTNVVEYFLNTDPIDAASMPAASGWNTYQGNAAHNGFVPVTLNSADFSVRWSVSPLNGKALNPVTAADGKVFVSEFSYFNNSQSVATLNAVNGSTVWSQGYAATSFISPPAYANGKVYFQTGTQNNSYIRALDADTGTQVYQTSYQYQWSHHLAPTPYDGDIYMAGGFGGAYSFDGASGSLKWFSNTVQYDRWTPAVDQNYVYTYTGQLNAINRVTGATDFYIADLSWNGWNINATPTLGDNRNALVIAGGRLANFDLRDRSISWQINSGYVGQPSVALGKVFAVNNNASLNVIDEATGQLLWSWTSPNGSGALSGNIVATLNLAFVQTTSATYAIDLATHATVWSYPASGDLALSNEGALYISTQNGTLVAITTTREDADNDGAPAWWEGGNGLNDNDASDASLDADADGLSNLNEYQQATNPLVADTDADGISDGNEVNIHNTLPLNQDTDGDDLSDGAEILTYFTNPLLFDSDADGFGDGAEINLYGTNPNDSASMPAALTSISESFEGGAIPADWITSSWSPDSTNASAGSYSLRSGAIGNSQQSSVELSGLFVAGSLTFSARVDAEPCCDRLEFYVDGVQLHSIHSSIAWGSYQVNLSAGQHTLEWRYVKDSSVASGADSAWIDNVTFGY